MTQPTFKTLAFSTFALGTIVLTACTAEQIDMATQAVGTVNAVRSSSAGDTSGGSSGSVKDTAKGMIDGMGISVPTKTQSATAAKLVTMNTGDAQANMILPRLTTALPTVMLAVSCHLTTSADGLPPMVAKYSVAGITGFTGAKNGMTKHPGSRCTDIAGLSNFKATDTTLSFTTTFHSAQSGETQTRQYTVAKQKTGSWLFTSGS